MGLSRLKDTNVNIFFKRLNYKKYGSVTPIFFGDKEVTYYTPTAGSQIMLFTTNWRKIGAEILRKEVSAS
jgi:hypothetical protein